jgi:putative heme-binding domain-containing protein
MKSLRFAFLMLVTLHEALFTCAWGATANNPVAGDIHAIADGAARFRTSCSLCHGLHAEGGSRGPDLTRGVWHHGGTDAELFYTITHGVPGTLMAGHDLTDTETWAVIAYLRSLAPREILAPPGSAANGKKLFYGSAHCSQCHMVDGQGGRLGPNLSRVGEARSMAYLSSKVRDPNSVPRAVGLQNAGTEWPLDYDAVVVKTIDGQTFAGVIRDEDSFSIQMMDAEENIRLFLKKDLQSVMHQDKTLMPAYGKDVLPDSALQDLVAFLESLRGQGVTAK